VRRRLRAFFNHPGCVGLAQPDGVRIAGSQPHALEVDGLARAWVAAVEDRAAGRAVDLQMDGVDQVKGIAFVFVAALGHVKFGRRLRVQDAVELRGAGRA